MLTKMTWAYSLTGTVARTDRAAVIKAYLIGILLLIIIFYLAVWFLKSYRNGVLYKRIGRLKLLDSLMLSRDSALLLVKVNDRYLLLSSTASSVSLITELDSKDFDSSDITDSEINNSGLNRSFSQYLKEKLMNGGKK